MQNLEFVLISGLSGAGKSEAVKVFEDMGYFCIDNMPPVLMPKLAEVLSVKGSKIKKVALVSDIRAGESLDGLFQALSIIKKKDLKYSILYLEADEQKIIQRFKETRRKHPLEGESMNIIESIRMEKGLLRDMRGAADVVINTSNLQAYELKNEIKKAFQRKQGDSLFVYVVSFGYKYGVPMDADLVIDVRFLPNPFYDPKLKKLSGENKKVKDFVMKRKETKTFMKKFLPMLKFLLPNYAKEGKTHINIAIGCTGGAHRSVVLANEVYNYLKSLGYETLIRHRDTGRDISK